jgi:hypothetical protein
MKIMASSNPNTLAAQRPRSLRFVFCGSCDLLPKSPTSHVIARHRRDGKGETLFSSAKTCDLQPEWGEVE